MSKESLRIKYAGGIWGIGSRSGWSDNSLTVTGPGSVPFLKFRSRSVTVSTEIEIALIGKPAPSAHRAGLYKL
jgi:hypothetical protein